MDRWPSEREEPKAPDKNVDALNTKDNNIIMKLKSEPHFPNCGKTDDYSPRVLVSRLCILVYNDIGFLYSLPYFTFQSFTMN